MGEFGEALHTWRDRVSPAEVGLRTGDVRRAPGLRREELAQLAGLSMDYIVRLEQGRSTAPSVQVLSALARALRLSDAERNHLFLLAGQAAPTPAHVSSHIPPSVQRLLDQLAGAPLSVYDAGWNLLVWNPLWAALVGDPSSWRGRDRNVLWRHFMAETIDPALPRRVRHTPEAGRRFESAMVADLRSATARYPSDAGIRSLVDDLRQGSSRFAELWDEGVVGFHESDRKTIQHPELGPVTLDCDVLTVPGSDLRIVAYSAAVGSEAVEKLQLLAVIGTQSLSPYPT